MLEYVLRNLNVSTVEVPSFKQALALVGEEKSDVLVGDYVTLKYNYDHLHYPQLDLKSIVEGRSEVAFAFRKQDNMIDAVNQALTGLQDDNEVHFICNQFLHPEDVYFCLI